MPLLIINLVMATKITIPKSPLFNKFLITNVYIFCVYFCLVCTRIPLTSVTSCIQQRWCFSRFLIASYYKWQSRVVTRKLLGLAMTVQQWGAERGSSRSRPPGKQFLLTVIGTDEGRAVLLYCNSRAFHRTKKSLDACRRSVRVSFGSELSVLHLDVTGIASCF